MALTDEDLAQIRKIVCDELRSEINHTFPKRLLTQIDNNLAAIGARETCPVCDHNHWTIKSVAFRGSSLALGRVCMRCWYIQFFDLMAARPLITEVPGEQS